MDKFDKILKEKVENFEIPYNDAHWAEMEGKLDKIRATKIKTTILSIAAGVVGLGIAGYLIFSPTATNKNTTQNNLATNNTETPELIKENKSETNVADNKPTITEEEVINTLESTTINQPSEQIEPVEKETTNENNIDVIYTDHKETITTNNNSETENNSVNNNAIVNTKITADFIVYNNSICVGEEVSFESIETDAQVSYLWNFGDGEISYETNPTHIYEHHGAYDVTLTLINKQTGEEFTKIKHDAVQILPVPKTYFTYNEESKKHDDNKLSYPYTIFKVKDVEKGTSYKWNFGNNHISTGKETKTTYQKADNYIVTLIAENEFGCVKTDQKRVKIKDGINLFAPDAFTPNQDGTNENFIPVALLEWNIPFEMIISNKAGTTVYKTTDKNEPWNGKLNNSGQLLEQGIYFWQIIITDAYGVKHSYRGNIKIIR